MYSCVYATLVFCNFIRNAFSTKRGNGSKVFIKYSIYELKIWKELVKLDTDAMSEVDLYDFFDSLGPCYI